MDAKGYSRIPRELCYWITFLAEALPLRSVGTFIRCQPWRAKRRLVDPSSREAALFSRRALRQRENKVGIRTRRPVIGSQVRSSNELAKLLRSNYSPLSA